MEMTDVSQLEKETADKTRFPADCDDENDKRRK